MNKATEEKKSSRKKILVIIGVTVIVAIIIVVAIVTMNNQNYNGLNPFVRSTTISISSIVHDPQKYVNTQVQIEGYLLSYVPSYNPSANYGGIGELSDKNYNYYVWLVFPKNVTPPTGAIKPVYQVTGVVGYYNSTEGVLPQGSYYVWVDSINLV